MVCPLLHGFLNLLVNEFNVNVINWYTFNAAPFNWASLRGGLWESNTICSPNAQDGWWFLALWRREVLKATRRKEGKAGEVYNLSIKSQPPFAIHNTVHTKYTNSTCWTTNSSTGLIKLKGKETPGCNLKYKILRAFHMQIDHSDKKGHMANESPSRPYNWPAKVVIFVMCTRIDEKQCLWPHKFGNTHHLSPITDASDRLLSTVGFDVEFESNAECGWSVCWFPQM